MVRFEEMGSSLEVFISNIQPARECWPTHQSSLKVNAETSGEGEAFKKCMSQDLECVGVSWNTEVPRAPWSSWQGVEGGCCSLGKKKNHFLS